MQQFKPVVVRGFLSEREVADIRADRPDETAPGSVGGSEGAAPASIRESDVGWLKAPQHRWLIDRLQPVAEQHCDERLALLPSVQYGCYRPGGHYAWHKDALAGSFSWRRRVSMSIPLAHAGAGGRLEIQGHSLPDLRPGDLVVFPSNVNHRVTTVTEGERESLVAWFERENRFEVQPQVLTGEEIQTVVDGAFRQLSPSLHDGKVIPGCTHKIAWLSKDDAAWRWLFDKLVAAAEKFAPGEAIVTDTLMVAEYREGDEYHMHPDSRRGAWTESRRVSMSVLLEEAEEGGRFELRDKGVVSMDVGDALVFDSDMYHRVRPVRKGRRRALVFWMRALKD